MISSDVFNCYNVFYQICNDHPSISLKPCFLRISVTTVIPVWSGRVSELTECLTINIKGAKVPAAVTAIIAVISNFVFDMPMLVARYWFLGQYVCVGPMAQVKAVSSKL